MKITITGASGFLGSHLLRRLKDKEEYIVCALSSRPDELREKTGGGNISYFPANAVGGPDAAAVLKDAIVVNCAYPRGKKGTDIADGLKYIQTVFEAAAKQGALAVINISSQSVYSQLRTEMATEDTPVSLESPYAVGKYAMELLLSSICKNTGICFTNLRMASLIGPGFDIRLVNRFIIKMLEHETVTVVRQEKRMGFLDVEDAVSAILSLAGTGPEHWQPVYNAGSGKGYTVEEIFDAAACELRKTADVPDPVIETGTDVSSTAVSFERLHADTGFVPETDLNKSIERIIAALRSKM